MKKTDFSEKADTRVLSETLLSEKYIYSKGLTNQCLTAQAGNEKGSLVGAEFGSEGNT